MYLFQRTLRQRIVTLLYVKNCARCLYNEVPSVANRFSPEEAQTQTLKLSLNPYLPCCVVCDECASSEAVRSWKLCGSQVKSLPWSPASNKNPNVVVVRYFRSNVRPGVATLYPTKHKCIPKKIVGPGSISLTNEEFVKQRGLSAGKIKSEMRKIAFKIKKEQWTRKTTDTLIVRPDEPSRKADPFTFPAPKLNDKAWGQNDNKVLFESKSLKELKERITKKKPKDSPGFPPTPVGIRLTASSNTHIQTSGIPSRIVLLSEPKPKQKDAEPTTESKAFSLPSPFFFIQQTLNKESLRGTFSDPSLVKEIKNKNKKTEEKPKDLKVENIINSHTPSPRLLASGNEGGSTNILRRQIESALKYTLPQKTAQDILGTIILSKEEQLKDNPDQKNLSYPSPSLKYSGVFSAMQENVSRSSSHVWPDEIALTPAAREANSFKKKSNNELTVGYDDYLRKTDKDIRQKRTSKTVIKEVVVYKDDKNRQDLSVNKLILTKEISNIDQQKKISNDPKILSYSSSLTLKDNVAKNKTSSKSYGASVISSVVPNPNNPFNNVIKENQSTNNLQKAKVQDHSPFLDNKPLNNFSSVLKKDMHSRSSNSGDKNEKDNVNDWELQIHSNKNAPSKADDRQNESVGNYTVAEEGLPSGKRVLHLYSKKVLEVTSPVIDHGNEKNQTGFNKFKEDEDIYRLNDKKANASDLNVYQGGKDNINFSRIEEVTTKPGNQETSGRRLMLGKRKAMSEEEPVESSNDGKLNINETRTQKRIYTNQNSFPSTNHHIKPNVFPVESPVESTNYGELNRNEARNPKENYAHPHSHATHRYNKLNVLPAEDPVESTNYEVLNRNGTQNQKESYSHPHSHTTYRYNKPKGLPAEDLVESPNYGKLNQNEARNQSESFAHPHSHTTYHYNKPKVSPVEDPVESPNQNETESYPQQKTSHSAYYNEIHTPGYDNIETHRDYSDPMPSANSRREFNPRVPVHGQFAPYYPSSSDDAPVTVDYSYSKFDRKLSNLSSRQTRNNLPPQPTCYCENIRESDHKSTHSKVTNAYTQERRQPHFNSSEDLHSKHSSQEMSDIYSSEQTLLKSSNDQDLEPRKLSNSSAIIQEDRTRQLQSSVESLDSNFSPNSDYLDFEFPKAKKTPVTQTPFVDRKSNKSEVQRDTNKILSRRKRSNNGKGHHSYASYEESHSSFLSANPSRLIKSSQTPKRFEYNDESTTSPIKERKEKDRSVSGDDRALNNIEREQRFPFDISKLVKENVKRNRDVSIETEIRQKVDNQAFEYTMAEASRRSFEELKNLVNEGLHVQGDRSKTKSEQDSWVLLGNKHVNGATTVSPPSVQKRTSKVSDVKHDYSKDDVSHTETKTKFFTQDPSISSLDRKSLRNSYYHIGKAKSCLETFLENVTMEQGYLNSSQTSFDSNKNNVNEYNESHTPSKFEYNYQKKFTKIQNLTSKEVKQNTPSQGKSFKRLYDSLTNTEGQTERIQPITSVKPDINDPPKESSYNSNFEKNIVKSVGIVNKLKSKSEKIDRNSVEKVPATNRQFQVWDAAAVNKAAPKLQRKKGDWYNHYKNRNNSTTISNNFEPPRTDFLQDPSRTETSPHSDPSIFYSTRPTSRSDLSYSHSLDQSSNAVKSRYTVSPSYSAQTHGQQFDASLQEDAIRAYKYAYDYYHDYYSKPNATGAIDSIPPNLLNDTYSHGLEEAGYSNAQDSSHHKNEGLNTWSQSNKARSPHSILSPSPDFSHLIDGNPDTNMTGNYLPGFNAPENVTYANSHHDYWSRLTARNSVNPGMSKHYSHSLGANHNGVKTETVKTSSHGLEMSGNTVNLHPNRQYPYGQEASNNVNSGSSYDFGVPINNLNTDTENNYSYYRSHHKKSIRHPNLHYSYRLGVPEHTNAGTNKNVGYEQSMNSEVERGSSYENNVSKNKSSIADNYNKSGKVEMDVSDSVKYSPSGLRVYDKEHRGLSDVQSDVRVDAVNEKSIPDFKENIKIANMDRHYSSGRGRMFKSSENSTMSHSRRKHTLKPTTSEPAVNKSREADLVEPIPPEFIYNFPDNSKKGFSLLDLPKNLSGYFQKIVSWKNTKDHNYGEGDFSRGVVRAHHTPKEKHPIFTEIPSNKENPFEKFTKPILESINRNVDSYYVKSVFVDNPMKSISKVAFARRVANVGSGVDPEEGNCTTCMKLSKLSSSIQSGVPFLKSKKLNYNFTKGYISSNGNPQNDSTDVVKEKDTTKGKNQNWLHSNLVKKPEQSDEKLFNNYCMPFTPTKPEKVLAEYNIQEDLKAEELNYLNPYINNRPGVVNHIKPNVKSKQNSMTKKKLKSSDKHQVKMPTRSKVTYVTKNVTNKLKSALSKSNLVSKPIEEADLKSKITAKPEMADLKERMVIKKKNVNDSVVNIVNNQIRATDSKGKLPRVNTEIQQEPIAAATEKSQVVNIVRTSVQSVGKSISDVISTSSKTVSSKIKRSNPARIKSADVAKVNMKSPKVELSLDVDNGNVVNSTSKKSRATKSLVNVFNNLSSDRKENPYKAFSDLYSN